MLELAVLKLTRPETAGDHASLVNRLERIERDMKGLSSAPRSNPVPPAPTPSPPKPTPAPDPAPVEPPAEQDDDAPATEEPGHLDRVMEDAAKPLVGEPDVPLAPAAISFDDFRALWPQLFGGLRELLGARRWALFRETEPGTVEGSTLVIDVRHDFHLQSLQADPAVAAVVATKASDLLAASVSVAFRAAGSTGSIVQTDDEPVEHEPVPEKHDLLEEGTDATDPFTLVENELGGVVVEEFEGE